MTMKIKILVKSVALLLSLLLACTLAACGGEPEEKSYPPEPSGAGEATDFSYDDINVTDYVKALTYKGLQVSAADGASAADALWDSIYATAQIDSYPEQKVSYYFDQIKKSYMSAVGGNADDYALLLESRGITEQTMLEQARQMVKEDLVYLYIVQVEGLELTDAEKTSLFDKYVDRYAVELGRPREYVAENMTEYIYESMLYDKTMEFLLASNELT